MLKKSLFLALLMGWLAASSLEARTWTDRQGQQTDAQFVRMKGDSVVLQKGLKLLVIPLKEFCDEDQEYIKELTKGKGSAKSASGAKSEEATKDAALPSAFKPKNEKNSDTEKNAAKEKSGDDDDPFLTGKEKTAKSKPAAEPKPTAKSKPEAESNPFLADGEKSSPDEDKDKKGPDKTPQKPKGEKPEVPQINTDGGFDERTWTDVKGNKLDANFSHLEGKIVVLLKKGEEQSFPIDQFSYNDKLYIRQAMLELQKYQKFTGNLAQPTPQAAVAAQKTQIPTPSPTRFPTPNPASNYMAQAMQQAEARRQEAEARWQKQEEQLNRVATHSDPVADRLDGMIGQRIAQNNAEQAKIRASTSQLRAETEQRMQEGLKKMDDHTMPTSAMPSFPVPCSTSTNADGDKSFFDDPSKNIKAGIVVGILLILVVVLVALILHMIFGRLPPDAKTRDLSSAEMISCFLFPGICLLAGLLWMIQGFHKGKAATLYSGGMIILRMIIAAILIASK